MHKTTLEYAKMLYNLYHGNKDLALAEVFNAAKTQPIIENSYWRDVFIFIQGMK